MLNSIFIHEIFPLTFSAVFSF